MKNYLVLTIMILAILKPSVWAKDVLTWQVVHWPPFQMLEGADKGQGRYDALLALYQANLPQYEHKTIQMNWARFWSDIKEGKEICNMFAIKTEERSTYAVFSKPLSIGLPLRIIMRKESIKTLGISRPISLVTLLKDSQFKGVFISRRSYYQPIDQILGKYASMPTVNMLAVSDENAIRMILAGRMDYTLEYPYVANYMTSKFQSGYDATIGSIPVEELQDFGVSCLACPDNAWGKKVVADFDMMLEQVKQQPGYLSIMQMYHTDPKELEDIRREFQKHIIEAE